MSSEKTTALVIRLADFSESSSVVTMFTRDFGKITALAKGAKRPKSSFESALDLLSVCRVVFIHKSSDVLDLLTEAKLEQRFQGTKYGISQVYAGYYIAELLRELTDEADPSPELFDLAVQILEEISTDAPVGRKVLRFELSALRILGHLPAFTECVESGVNVPLSGKVPFSIQSGGVISPKHLQPHANVLMINAGVLKIMETFSQENDAWRMIQVDRRMMGEVRRVLNPFLYHHLGRKPKMHDYLELLSR